jgi:hypothetical protein
MDKNSLTEIIEDSLADCSQAQREFFASIRVDFYPVPIRRLGKLESVLVIADFNDSLVYYEDIEEGFAIDQLDDQGAIPKQDCSQFELRHVLYQLQSD